MKAKKVLIVDDDRVSLTLLKRIVEELGYTTILSSDGARAWSILQDNSDIDLVVSDMVMPELDGRKLIEKLRAVDKLSGVSVIIVSGIVRIGEISDLLGHGADYFVPKPIEKSLLKTYINNLIGETPLVCKVGVAG